MSRLFPSKQDAERQHREVVSVYRTHLLSAAQVIVYKCVLSVKFSFLFLQYHFLLFCSYNKTIHHDLLGHK